MIEWPIGHQIDQRQWVKINRTSKRALRIRLESYKRIHRKWKK